MAGGADHFSTEGIQAALAELQRSALDAKISISATLSLFVPPVLGDLFRRAEKMARRKAKRRRWRDG